MIKHSLSFSIGNAKLKADTLILSLPASHSCPFAKNCRTSADKETGKLTNGKDCQYRCYAASTEALFKNVRKSRWNNFESLKRAKTIIGMANLIEQGIINRKNIKLVRYHQSGDFFSQDYFDAWLLIAKNHPELIFYGYTKSIPYLIKRMNEIPGNFKIVASRGGVHDNLINLFGLRSAIVVYSEKEAKNMNLETDHDDSHCWNYNKDFAIVIHGNQPAGTDASKAWQKIVKSGAGGYKSDYFAHYNKQKTVKVNSFNVPPINLNIARKIRFVPTRMKEDRA